MKRQDILGALRNVLLLNVKKMKFGMNVDHVLKLLAVKAITVTMKPVVQQYVNNDANVPQD